MDRSIIAAAALPAILTGYVLVPSSISAQSTAAVAGIVFEDVNGDGQQNGDEAGISGVTVVAVDEDTGAPITTITGSDGAYRIEAGVIDHQVRVDESTLPFNGELTTSRLEYGLNVPPGFTALDVSFGYREVEPAGVRGMVFGDTNGNGSRDDGEAGLGGVGIDIVHEATGAVTTVTTAGDGTYRHETSVSRFDVSVDESTLPFTAQLTTGREEYDLNVPPGFTALEVSFGYREVEPSAVAGTVFDDENDNGRQDDGEPGIPGVTLDIRARADGETTTVITSPDGTYRYETSVSRFDVSVDESSLPFAEPILTTSRAVVSLNVPNGFVAPSVDFGYRAAAPEDEEEIEQAGGTGPTGGEEEGAEPANPFDDPDPDLPVPDDLPEDAGEYAFPLEGPWVVHNLELTMTCGGMPGMNQPPMAPQRGTIRLEDGGRTLIGQGFDRDTAVLTASEAVRGLYTGRITVQQPEGEIELDFFLQVVTPERIVGYLTGSAQARGVTCRMYRPFHMEYEGG